MGLRADNLNFWLHILVVNETNCVRRNSANRDNFVVSLCRRRHGGGERPAMKVSLSLSLSVCLWTWRIASGRLAPTTSIHRLLYCRMIATCRRLSMAYTAAAVVSSTTNALTPSVRFVVDLWIVQQINDKSNQRNFIVYIVLRVLQYIRLLTFFTHWLFSTRCNTRAATWYRLQQY